MSEWESEESPPPPAKPVAAAARPVSASAVAVRGAAWSVSGAALRAVFSVIVFFILARLLGPELFGLVAAAQLLVSLCLILAEQGLGRAIVQRQELGPAHLQASFWISIASAAALMLVLIAIGLLLRGLGLASDVALFMMALGPMLLISASAATPQAILEREQRWRSITLRSIFATVLGGAAGIVAALLGWGAWALVVQAYVGAAAGLLTLLWATSWRPSRHFDRKAAGDLIGFSLHTLGIRLLHYGQSRGAQWVILGILGSSGLALFQGGIRMVNAAIDITITGFSRVAMSAFSRVQSDRDRLRRGFLAGLGSTALVAFPAFLMLSALAEEFVLTVLGDKWIEAIPIVAIYAPVGALYCVGYFNSEFLNSIGRPDLNLRLNLVLVPLTVVLVGGFAVVGLHAVAWAFIIAALVGFVARSVLVFRHSAISLADVAREVAAPLLASCAAVAAIIVFRQAEIISGSAPLRLLGLGAAGGITYIAVCGLIARTQLKRLLDLAMHAVPKLERRQGARHVG